MRRPSKRVLLTATLATPLLLGAAAYGLLKLSKIPCFQLVGEVTCRVETQRKIVALSFDDGPTRQGVDAVLPVLDQFGVSATFFLVGSAMETAPDQTARLLGAGHELGNHSWSHKHNIGRLPGYYRAEVERTSEALRAAGSEPTLFRPPYGSRLIGLPWAVEKAGLRMVTWDVADRSLSFSDPAEYAQDILGQVRPGSIILMHVMYSRNQVARDGLPLVLQGLEEMGYEVVPVSKLIELGETTET